MRTPKRLLASALLVVSSIVAPALATQQGASATTPEPPDVFAIGDSIFTRTGANTFGTEFPAALSTNSMVSIGIDANSGRSISSNGLTPALGSGLDAVANHGAELADAEILITDLGINDSEFGAAWETLARQFISEVKTANPEITIAWITPVAEIGVAGNPWEARAADHGPIVRALASEGLIDILVEWDTYALAHTDVFHTDGVHYWVTGDTVQYSAFAAEWLADNYEPPAEEPEPEPDAPTTNGPADDQVLRLYQAALGRVPDAAGLAHWTLLYRRGASLESIATEFMGGSEWAGLYGSAADSEALIGLLYTNALGRSAADSEVQYWLGQMAAGLSQAQLVIRFSDSEENVARTGTEAPLSSQASQILRLYRAALGRTPDQGGLDYWTSVATNGNSVRSIAIEFMASDEWGNRYGSDPTNDELITLLYSNVLDRQPDSAGAQYWLAQMSNGLAPVDVLVSFSNSNENLDLTGTN